MRTSSHRMIAVLLFAAAAGMAAPCHAQPSWPYISPGYDSVLQSDGRKVQLGAVHLSNRDGDVLPDGTPRPRGFALIRWNRDGTLDTTFNGTGYVAMPIWGAYDRPTQILVQPDDGIVVVGNAAFPCGSPDPRECDQYLAVARFQRDGSNDTTFNRGGKVTARVACGASSFVTYRGELDGGGNVLIFAWPRPVSELGFPVARIHPDGSADATFHRGSSSLTVCETRVLDSDPVIEFYNATLDHYFVTADPAEFTALDTGTVKGWERTGWAFAGYASDRSASTTARPVCRYYGDPAAGLATHFYSAIPGECAALASRPEWILESADVFRVDLPDILSGACPAGATPVYRLWNRRADANHRFTTSVAVRDEMVARGYVSEGYGRDGVAMCAPTP